MARKPTHIATICKLEKTTTPSGDKLLVCIPIEIQEGVINASKKFTDADGSVFMPAYEAFNKGEKQGYIQDISYKEIVERGRKVLEENLNYDYDEDNIRDRDLIIDDYRSEYAEDMRKMVWFFDLRDLVTNISGLHEEEFYEMYDMSIDRKKNALTSKPPKSSKSTEHGRAEEDEIEEDDTKVFEMDIDNTDQVEKEKSKIKFTRIGLIDEVKKYVISQDEVVEQVVSAIYKPIVLKEPMKIRNILLYGPTGSGKTYIGETIAKLLDMPYFYSSVANFSSSGYVGGSVEDLYVGLYRAAGSDIKKLEKGAILFVDEVDKLLINDGGSSSNIKTQVFDELLPIYQHGGVATFKPTMYANPIRYNTKNLFIITGGSFSQLEKILDRTMGFGETYNDKPKKRYYTKEDFEKKLGIHKEWLGRQDLCLPVNELSENDLYRILTIAHDSPYIVDISAMNRFGIHLNISEGSLRKIASKAYELKTGARALRGTYEFALEKITDEIVDKIDAGEDMKGKEWNVPEEEIVKRLGTYYG